MKRRYFISVLVISIFAIAVLPVKAQLGVTDTSSFTVQNISDSTATVWVKFYNESGTEYTPIQLDQSGTFPNPFTLSAGSAKQIYVPNIPTSQLPSGRYAVVLSSDQPIAAMVGVAGDGTVHFVGTYSGASAGANLMYLPTVTYNYYGWYSMISVQNVGASPADITVTIKCNNTTAVGTLQANDVPVNSSVTWALKNITPTGFTSSTTCQGSAVISSDQPIVAANNQNQPSTGATNSFEAYPSGSKTVFVPNLSNSYYGWNSALNIMKLGSGTTVVTVDYDDSEPNDICNLSDTNPSCQLYMPVYHPTKGRFGATITSTSLDILVSVGQTHTAGNSSGYTGILDTWGTDTVYIPLATKGYYGWSHAINCQNVGSVNTTISFTFQGFSVYNHPETLSPGESTQLYVPNLTFLPNGYYGGVKVKANAAGAKIACTVGGTNTAGTTPGDWSNQYNAFNR